MNVEQFNRENNGFFKATEEDNEAGRMTYTWAGENQFIIDHTEVKAEFNGKGVGKKLVMAAVNYARENHVKIIPLCPFAKSVFIKVQEIRDVL